MQAGGTTLDTPTAETFHIPTNTDKRLMIGWRILLVEFAYQLSKFLDDSRRSGQVPKHKQKIESLLETCVKLADIPDEHKEILIRFRGRGIPGEDRNSEKYDYVMQFGNMTIEIPLIKAITKRGGAAASHLPWRLVKAFERFASLDVNTLRIDIGSCGQNDQWKLRRSLQILTDYFKSMNALKGVSDNDQTIKAMGSVIYNDKKEPDPNLTLLAGLNRIKPESIQALVPKIAQAIHNAAPDSKLKRCAGVFDAIFHFKDLREQLQKPPIELNNVRLLMLAEDQEVISTKDVSLTREVMDRLVNSPQKAFQIMENFYGNEFIGHSADGLEQWLDQISHLLQSLEKRGKNKEVEDAALQFVKIHLDSVSEETLDNLSIQRDKSIIGLDHEKIDNKKLHPELSGMIDFFKKRSATRKKMRNMLHQNIIFCNQDYGIIAKDFGISIEGSRQLIILLRECFDSNGRFLRNVFEKNIPEFLKYEKNIFQFLRHYLKELMNRNDRVSYLNSLQLLIAQMQQPQEAIKLLLADFISCPLQVTFFDRNAFILANILIRKYNKELRNDVEITPEEVLLVRDGLDNERIRVAAAYIAKHKDLFYQKIRMVQEMIEETVSPRWTNDAAMSIHYLTTLAREVYIFLSLVGGTIAHKIVRDGVEEYGDPFAKLYTSQKSPLHMKKILQLFNVMLRSLERFANIADLPFLQEIQLRENLFLANMPDDTHKNLTKMVFKRVNMSIQTIENAKMNALN